VAAYIGSLLVSCMLHCSARINALPNDGVTITLIHVGAVLM